MSSIARYVMSVICAAALGGILTSILPEKSGVSGILRLLTGLYLIITLINPLVRFNFASLDSFLAGISGDIETPVWDGEQLAKETAAEIIKAETEAYILDKAHALGASLEIEVFLSDDDLPVPRVVTIAGAVSASVKRELERILTEELGIEEGNLRWS